MTDKDYVLWDGSARIACTPCMTPRDDQGGQGEVQHEVRGRGGSRAGPGPCRSCGQGRFGEEGLHAALVHEEREGAARARGRSTVEASHPA